MNELDKALDARMLGDSYLTGLLATYRSSPAIFFQSPLPEGVTPPYVAVPPIPTQTANDTKTDLGRVIVRDIGCYTAADGDPAKIDAIAERVHDLFHRHPLNIVGYQTMIAMVDGPIVAPTDKTLYGRIVSVQLTVWKT